MKIDRDLVDEAMRLYGISSYKDLAQRAHLNPGHLSRVLSRGTCNASTANKLIGVLSYTFYPGTAAEQARQRRQMLHKQAEHLASTGQMSSDSLSIVPSFPVSVEAAKAIKEFLNRKIMPDWNHWGIQGRLIFWYQNWDRIYPKDLLRRDRVCAVEILQELFRKEPEHITRADVVAINQFLTTLPGWKKTNGSIRFGPYGKQRGFVRA